MDGNSKFLLWILGMCIFIFSLWAILDTIDGKVTVAGTTGVVIVKNNYGGTGVSKIAVANNPAKYLKAVTVMFKRKGYDADNADWFWVKYTPKGGTITVSVNVDEQRKVAICDVADTGKGIPAEDLPRIFDKFYRVDDHKKMAKGTGLGLNLVKQIIETVHHGKIKVQSHVGQGSTFTCVLPMVEDE